MKKKSKLLFILSIAAIFGFGAFSVFHSISPKIPQAGNPAIFYSNQCRQDLKTTTLLALKNAKKSIHMVMFGLSDLSIIDTLKNKEKDKLDIQVYYDLRSSPPIDIQRKAFAYQSRGLLHQKILVIDNQLVFIGSANMTKASLNMHDNLIIGLHSPQIANFLLNKSPFSSGYMHTMVGGQDVELWLLPDHQNKALASIRNLLYSAKNKIYVAMFTLTHHILVDELIAAHKRGVAVSVVMDFHSGIGSGAKVLAKLKKANVKVLLSTGQQLMHHKYLLVDDKTLVCGSTNWTKSAFNKNKDCFLILHHLNPSQKTFIHKLNKIIELEAR